MSGPWEPEDRSINVPTHPGRWTNDVAKIRALGEPNKPAVDFVLNWWGDGEAKDPQARDATTLLGVSLPTAYTLNEECWAYQEFEPTKRTGGGGRGRGSKGANPSTKTAQAGAKKGSRSFVCVGAAATADIEVIEANPLAIVPAALGLRDEPSGGLDAESSTRDSSADLAVVMAAELADTEPSRRSALPGKTQVVLSDVWEGVKLGAEEEVEEAEAETEMEAEVEAERETEVEAEVELEVEVDVDAEAERMRAEMTEQKKQKAVEAARRKAEAKRHKVSVGTLKAAVVVEDEVPEVRREGKEPAGLDQQGSSDSAGGPAHVPPSRGEYFSRESSDLEPPGLRGR